MESLNIIIMLKRNVTKCTENVILLEHNYLYPYDDKIIQFIAIFLICDQLITD